MDSKALTDLSLKELLRRDVKGNDTIIAFDGKIPYLTTISAIIRDGLGSENGIGLFDGDSVWDDDLFMLIGSRIDINAGRLDYNYNNKTITFDDNCNINNNTHKLHFSYELSHKYKLDGKVHLHLHWLQETLQKPNWLYRWRIWKNGEDVGLWNNSAIEIDELQYSGTGRMIQISHNGFIDLAPFDLKPSDFFEVELCRDCNNDSGLFAGNDPIAGKVEAKAFAPHFQINKLGTKTEFSG
jgi:hypothetical protein